MEEQVHNHGLVDDHSNQCLYDPRVDSASNHVIEEKDEDSQDVSKDHYVIESQIKCKPIEKQSQGDRFLVVSQHNQECSLFNLSSSLISYEEPSKDDFDSIPHSILDQDKLILYFNNPYFHREHFPFAPNLQIISRIKRAIDFEYFPSYQTPKSISPSYMGENICFQYFQSTLPSHLFKSSCMGSCSNQVLTFEIFSKES